MRWKTKLIGIAAALGAFTALGAAAPANAQVSFSFGVYGGGPFAAPQNCYWERIDRRRSDVVQQVCRDNYGRAYIVPGSRYRVQDQYWSRWDNGRWNRDWNRGRNDWGRNDWRRNDWDRNDRGRDRDWDRGGRDRDWDRNGRDRDRDRGRDWDRRNR